MNSKDDVKMVKFPHHAVTYMLRRNVASLEICVLLNYELFIGYLHHSNFEILVILYILSIQTYISSGDLTLLQHDY